MSDDKKIDFYSDSQISVHRLTGRIPELQKKYGLWIINTSTGGESASTGFETCQIRRFEFYSISHLFKGHGRLWLPNHGEQDLPVGSIVVIAPGDLNRYGGSNGQSYVEDSIRFCGPVADHLRAAGVIASRPQPFGPVRKLLPLIELSQDPSPDAQINANTQLQQLLVELYNQRRRRTAFSPMEELLETIKARPDHWWTVRELAEYCNLSTDQLRRNFERRTGMLPKTYIEQFKLRQAAELLIASRLSISEIAERFGYLDPYHFSRRFKLLTGVSPEHYRREYPRSN